MPVAMQVPKSYFGAGFKNTGLKTFKLFDYDDYIVAREFRLNVRAGRHYYDGGTRPIPLPKRLLG
jgi:hypothetical protein